MNTQQTYNLIGNVDIYLIDQILKHRFHDGESILDAGCGNGRNLKWFYQNNHPIAGIDINAERIQQARLNFPKCATGFQQGSLNSLPYKDAQFDHIICSAVLHFAKNEKQFLIMFSEMVRVLKHKGTLFIRVASDIGLIDKPSDVEDNDSDANGTFFITRQIISTLLETYPILLIDPIKTTNVQDVRAMTTLVFEKE